MPTVAQVCIGVYCAVLIISIVIGMISVFTSPNACFAVDDNLLSTAVNTTDDTRAVAISCTGEHAVVSSANYVFGFDYNVDDRAYALAYNVTVPNATTFGEAVAIDDDGVVIVAGDPGANLGRGVVYGFSDLTMTFVFAGDYPGAHLGAAVAIGGSHVAASAPMHANGGSVFILTTEGTVVGEIVADDGVPSDFGHSVALTCDGSRVVIGAPLVNEGRGRVYVKTTDNDEQTLVIEDAQVPAGSRFGRAVAVAGNGQLVVVGAPDLARVYLFQLIDGQYVEQTRVQEVATAGFGRTVSLDESGQRLYVGSDDGGTFFYHLNTISGQYELMQQSGTTDGRYSLAVSRSANRLISSVDSSEEGSLIGVINCTSSTSSCPSCS